MEILALLCQNPRGRFAAKIKAALPEKIGDMIGKNFSTAVMVSDEKEAAKWYAEKLGFETSVHEGWTTVWPKGATSKLHLCEGELEPGNTGIGLFTEEIEATVDELKTKGVKFSKPVTEESWGTYAMIQDPYKNEIWLLKGAGP
jgi:predicted enzyme related to lactoylglutathione lyase